METETKLTQFIQKETIIATIQTQQEVDLCLIQNKRAKAMIDWAEERRQEATRPILASKKAIDDLWKVREAPLLAIIDHNKKNLQTYLLSQETEKAKELKEDAGFNKKESTNLAKIETKAESGVSYRNDWDLEITNISVVPEKFIIKTLDEKAIKEHLRNGGVSVKGVKITPKKIIINK
jgi:hypothetical protein